MQFVIASLLVCDKACLLWQEVTCLKAALQEAHKQKDQAASAHQEVGLLFFLPVQT